MDNLLTVQNYSVLSALQNHSDGEVAYCKDEDKYYLLYGKEIGYFTLFQENNNEKEDYGLGEGVIECLSSFEAIKEYDINEDAIEIWVKTEDDVTVLYLFGYDAGVVNYHG